MIDVRTEDIFPLREAPNRVPTMGRKKPHTASFYRRVSKGVQGVYLETCYHGGILCTSMEAMARFDAELTRIKCGPKPAKPATAKAASRAHEKALAKLGR